MTVNDKFQKLAVEAIFKALVDATFCHIDRKITKIVELIYIKIHVRNRLLFSPLEVAETNDTLFAIQRLYICRIDLNKEPHKIEYRMFSLHRF